MAKVVAAVEWLPPLTYRVKKTFHFFCHHGVSVSTSSSLTWAKNLQGKRLCLPHPGSLLGNPEPCGWGDSGSFLPSGTGQNCLISPCLSSPSWDTYPVTSIWKMMLTFFARHFEHRSWKRCGHYYYLIFLRLKFKHLSTGFETGLLQYYKKSKSISYINQVDCCCYLVLEAKLWIEFPAEAELQVKIRENHH